MVALVGLIALVVLFEGFDVSVTSIVLPYVGAEFRAGPQTIGQAMAAIGLGAIAAALLLRQADRFGRRPLLLIATGGFAAGSLATMLATELWHYAAFQFVTRMLAVTQISVAYLIVTETLPQQWRGRINGLLGALGSLGAALPFMLMERVMATSLGWRGLFLIGGLPLLVLPLLFFLLPETTAFTASRRRGMAGLSLRAQVRQLWSADLRQRFVLVSLLWLLINFASVSTSVFFTTYVVNERGWKAADLVVLGPAILAAAALGNITSGYLLDRVGRRFTIGLFLVALGLAAQLGYSSDDRWLIGACWIAIQSTYGIWAAGFTLTSELFPVHLRGAANGACNNLIGRWGMVIAPAVVGALGARLGGVGDAAFWCSFAAYAALPVLWLLPETRERRSSASVAEKGRATPTSAT